MRDLNIPSSSTPFKKAPMAPRYPSCLRNSACWLPLKDYTGISKESFLTKKPRRLYRSVEKTKIRIVQR